MADGTNGYPSVFVSEAEKRSKEWLLKYGKAMWDSAMNQGSTINFGERQQQWKVNRKYAEGLEDRSKFKQQFSVTGDNTYMNLDWGVSHPLPSIVETIRGKLMNLPFKLQFEPVDSTSTTEVDIERNKLYATMLLKEQLGEQIEKGEIKVEGADKAPEDKEELEIYMQTDFKLAKTIAIESICRAVFQDNDMEYHKEKVIKDLIDVKMGGFRIQLDENKNIVLRHIAPINIVTSYVNKDDSSDARHIGEIIEVPISELRVMAQGQLSETELFEIAKTCANKNGNQSWMFGSSRYYNENIDRSLYDNFNVQVLDFELKSTDEKTFTQKEARNGGFYFDEKPFGYTPPKNPRRKIDVIKKKVANVYVGKYIVNTNYIFDYGKKEYIVREKLNQRFSGNTTLGFVVSAPDIYDMRNQSITERLIPYADELVRIQLKMQQFIAKAAPAGYAMDVDAVISGLQGMGLGGMKPVDARAMRDQIGDVYFRSIRQDGSPITNTAPIRELPDGITNSIIILAQSYNLTLQRMKEAVGLTGDANIGEPDKNALVGTQKIAISANNNALRPITNAYFSLVKRAAQQVSGLSQMLIRAGVNVDKFKNMVGTEAVNTVDMSKLPDAAFAIQPKMLPEEQELERIDQLVQFALQQGQISVQDVFTIRRVAKEDPEKAELVLSVRSKKRMAEQQAQKQAIVDYEVQQQQQSALVAAQAKQQTAQLEAQLEAQNKEIEYNLRLRNDKEIEEEKRKTMALESEYDIKKIEKAAQMKQQTSKDSTGYDITEDTMPRGVEPSVLPQEASGQI